MLIKVEAYFDGEHWCARGIGEDFFTQGKSLDKLMQNIKEVVTLHFEEELKKGKSLNILILSETELKSPYVKIATS
jgi:hypothetical protein